MKVYKPRYNNHNTDFLWFVGLGIFFLIISILIANLPGAIIGISIGIVLLLWGFYSWGPGHLQVDEEGLLFVKWGTKRRLFWHQITDIKKDRFQHPNPKHCYNQLVIHTSEMIFSRGDLWRYLNMLNYIFDGTERWQKKSKLKIEFEIGEQKWRLEDLKDIQASIEDKLGHEAKPVPNDEYGP